MRTYRQHTIKGLRRNLLQWLGMRALGAILVSNLAFGQQRPAPPLKEADCDQLHTQKACVRIYRSIVDPKDVADIFGNRIAKRFLVVQVTITNRDKDYQYLIQDVSLDLSEIFPDLKRNNDRGYELSSDDLSLLRGVAEKGQSGDPRNFVLRSLRGAGTIAAGLIGVSRFGNSYAPSVAVWNGPVVAAFSDIFPDYTINQMNRLNDNAYSANSIVPKQQSKVVAIFVPQAIFLTKPQQETFWKEPMALFQDPVKPIDLRKIEIIVDGNFIINVEDVGPILTAAVISRNEMKAFANDNSEVKGSISGRFLTDTDVKLVDADPNLTIRLDGTQTDTRIGFVISAKYPIPPGTVLKIGVSKKGQDAVKETDLAIQYAASPPTVSSIDQDTIKQGDTGKVLTISGTNFLPGATQVVIVPSNGITVADVQATDSKTLTAKISVEESASTSQRQIGVMTPGGTGSSLPLKITKKE